MMIFLQDLLDKLQELYRNFYTVKLLVYIALPDIYYKTRRTVTVFLTKNLHFVFSKGNIVANQQTNVIIVIITQQPLPHV